MKTSKLFQILLIAIFAVAAVLAQGADINPERDAKSGKWGFKDAAGKWVVKPKYEEASAFEEPFASLWKVRDGNKTGLFDLESGRLLVKTDYADVKTPIELNGVTYYPVKRDKGWGLNLSEDKKALDYEYLSVDPVYSGNYFFLHSSDKGYRIWCPLEDVMLTAAVDKQFEEKPFKVETYTVLKPSKKNAEGVFYRLFAEGVKFTRDGNGDIMPPSTQVVETAGDAYVVSVDSRYWVYDALGKKMFDRPFAAKPIRHGKYWESEGKLYSPGSEAVGFNSSDGVAYVVLPDGSCRLFLNDEIAPTAYEKINPVKEGTATVKRGGKWGISKDGDEIVACKYDADPQYDGNIKGFIVPEAGKVGLLDEAGKQVLAAEFDNIVHLDEGKVVCWKDALCGVYNTDGSPLIPIEYTDIELINAGYQVKKGTQVGLYDGMGRLIVPAEYDKIEAMEGLSPWLVSRNGKYGLIDSLGEVVLPAEYDYFDANGLSDNLWVKKDNLYGVCDEDGKILVPVKYSRDNIEIIDDYCYCTTDNTGKKYYRATGELIPQKRTAEVTSQSVEHNHYDKNNNKGLKINFNFKVGFSKNEPVYAEALVYNANGTPATSSKGGQIKHGYWLTPGYLSTIFEDQWITLPYTMFVQPKSTKRDYYIKLRFKDGNGREIPTTGNDKISFYLTR